MQRNVFAAILLLAVLTPISSFSQSFSSELKSIPHSGKINGNSCQYMDIDNDGDRDFMFTMMNFPLLYSNIGSSESPSFEEPLSMPFELKDIMFSTFMDIDGDGDLDAIGISYKKMKVGKRVWQMYTNTGTPEKPQFSEPVAFEFGLDKEFEMFRFVDIDGDDDLDILGVKKSEIYFQENQGDSKTPQFSNSTNDCFGLAKSSAIIDFADIDNDGDLDAYCFGKLDGEKDAKQYIQLNNGDKENPAFSDLTPATTLGIDDTLESVQFVDIDGDGDQDAVGTVKYKLFYQENTRVEQVH